MIATTSLLLSAYRLIDLCNNACTHHSLFLWGSVCAAEGLLVQRDWKTKDGFNAVFETNLLGHFLLVCKGIMYPA
jgi:hypothetical protein